jgi:hypothetical protein
VTFDLTAAFVRDGLDGGLKVAWLSGAIPGVSLVSADDR